MQDGPPVGVEDLRYGGVGGSVFGEGVLGGVARVGGARGEERVGHGDVEMSG